VAWLGIVTPWRDQTSSKRPKEMSASGKLEFEILRAEVIGLNRALSWERTQKERLLEELDRYQREIKRLHDRLIDLELQIAERKHVSVRS